VLMYSFVVTPHPWWPPRYPKGKIRYLHSTWLAFIT
jgi:hypothetical protein